jgi:transcriptional regulator with XRE-family HTH domain
MSRPGRKPKDPYWVDVGKRIRALRTAPRPGLPKGWTGQQLGDIAGVDPATVSNLENAKRITGAEQATIDKLAVAFKVSPTEIAPPRYAPGPEMPREVPQSPPASPGAAPPRDAEFSPTQLAQLRSAIYDTLADISKEIAKVHEARPAAPHSPGKPVR